jgi:hypothetical protein
MFVNIRIMLQILLGLFPFSLFPYSYKLWYLGLMVNFVFGFTLTLKTYTSPILHGNIIVLQPHSNVQSCIMSL